MKNRNYSIDLIKTVGVVMVVSVHFISHSGYYEEILSGKYMFVMTMILTLMMSCVPLFLLASGYLLINKKLEKGYFKSVLWYIIEVIFIYIGMTLVTSFLYGRTTITSNLNFLVDVLLLNPNYYIGLYLNVLILAPVLNITVINTKATESLAIMGVLLFVISLPRFLNYNLSIQFFEYRYILAFPILYYLTGAVVRKIQLERIKKRYLITIITVSTFLHAVLTFYHLRGAHFQRIYGNYENIFYYINSLSIFILLIQIDINSMFLKRVSLLISKYSLHFYIINPYFSDKILRSILPSTGVRWIDAYKIFFAPIASVLLTLPAAFLINRIYIKFNEIIKEKRSVL